ncbi:MAG TPA: PIN domain-containing protein [Thermoanaerobaculia bacterium]|nr:PIN domain-containing protein [Thermoanaerobaculia bacterium]
MAGGESERLWFVKRYWVDANVLLRFLTGEPEPMAERAARLMRQAQRGEALLILTPLVVAEVVWTLKSFYRRSYEEIVRVLVPLLSADGVETQERELLIRALELTRNKNVDFSDAVLAVQADRHGETVCTFDEDFKRLPAAWILPG